MVRLGYLLDGKIEYNYNPPYRTVDLCLASTMDLDKTADHLQNLIGLFFAQLDRMGDSEQLLVEKARSFCQDLMKRDSII